MYLAFLFVNRLYMQVQLCMGTSVAVPHAGGMNALVPLKALEVIGTEEWVAMHDYNNSRTNASITVSGNVLYESSNSVGSVTNVDQIFYLIVSSANVVKFLFYGYNWLFWTGTGWGETPSEFKGPYVYIEWLDVLRRSDAPLTWVGICQSGFTMVNRICTPDSAIASCNSNENVLVYQPSSSQFWTYWDHVNDFSRDRTVSNHVYGNGYYTMDWSSEMGESHPPSLVFNGLNPVSAGGHWGLYRYSVPSGNFISDSYIVQGYTGDWIKIRLPAAAYLQYIRIYARDNCCSSRRPRSYRLYGSSKSGAGWSMIINRTAAAYSGSMHLAYVPVSLQLTSFREFALVVNQLEGGDAEGHVLNFEELQLYASALPTCISAGRGYNASSSTCQSCSAGEFSDEASFCTKCSPCLEGTYSGKEGVALCNACPIGTYSPYKGALANSTCSSCAAGSYADVAASALCSKCPAGKYSTQIGATSSETCEPCQAGKYSAIEGANTSSACLTCPAGTFGAYSSYAQCTKCPNGKYSTQIGATSAEVCQSCSAGKYSSALEGADSMHACKSCPAGTYSEYDASAECSKCPAGTYSDQTRATSADTCQPCSSGMYSAAEGASSASYCSNCTAGSYATESGSVQCTLCPRSTYSLSEGATDSSVCIPCDAGFFSTMGSTQCYPCQKGGYRTSNLDSCVSCPPGTNSSITGSATPSNCHLCIAGFYSAGAAAACTMCPAGKYSSSLEGSVDCTACPGGTYSTTIGAASNSTCQLCNAGYYSLAGSPGCTQCPRATYNSQAGSDRCLPCGKGNYTDSYGTNTFCKACPANAALRNWTYQVPFAAPVTLDLEDASYCGYQLPSLDMDFDFYFDGVNY
jgi:hypothetical protein